MTGFDPDPGVPERDLPAHRHAALRTLLVEHAASTAPPHRRSLPRRPATLPRRPRWSAALPRPVAVSAVVALVALLVQFWPVPANQAFAAWTPVPQPVDAAELARIGDRCISDLVADDMLPGPAREARPVLVDRRGDAAVALVVGPGRHVAECTFLHLRGTAADHLAGGSASGSYEPRGRRAITIEETYSVADRRDAQGLVVGQIAPGAARVVVTLEDGTRVQAAIRDGWYLAWWPDPVRRILWWWSADQRLAASVEAYDAAGRLLGRTRA